MIHYTSARIGGMTIRRGNYKHNIQIRQGNCLAVFIHVHKMQEGERGYEPDMYWHSLYMFYNDESHLKSCIKEFGDMFGDEILSIRLNTYYKESFVLARYMTRCGHRVTLYYKEPKETKK